ncbi:hypothetical protein M8P87_13645 [Pseudomonas stutzeri]|uniref:hypothetical protein n=1 Tax=Stutzerimonas stutzeri TaxID=316 RepID=UPI00210CA59B|nr:hypothetical protein [Stutzerimonas stutzeri]MCQ4230888.1 hypothetical protein [Stutzerimonas stutzeri]
MCLVYNLSKEELHGLLEPHFHKHLDKDSYAINSVNSDMLVNGKRFDLAFKILYLEMREKSLRFATDIYKEHIRAFSLGGYVEPGQEETKNSLDCFLTDFSSIFQSIKDIGFDSTKTVLPITMEGTIANGAHRLASAIFLNQPVQTVKLDMPGPIYDYRFFYNRNVSSNYLDAAATKFIELADNVFVAFLWPVAQGHDKVVEQIIPNIFYRKDVLFTPNGAHNLLSQIYHGERWLGTVENNYSGVKGKLVECFKSFDQVRVIAFQAESLEAVIKIKEKIRGVFGVGKHSIHITDTKDEAVRVARLVLNENSLHFLNYAKPNRYLSVHKKIASFRAYLERNSINPEDIVLDSGVVLSIYGLREAADVDYLAPSEISLDVVDHLESHDEVLKHHGEDKGTLIYNPQYYFYFEGVKFLSFKQVFRMKSNRNESKDRNDCAMMKALDDNRVYKRKIAKLRQWFYYSAVKVKSKIASLLNFFGLFDVVFKIYKVFKK